MEHIRAQWGPGGFVPAGAHVIQLVDQNGDVALETPPLDLQPDRANMVVVFGRRKALEHRFLTTDLDVPPGLVRLVALNLIRTGYAVEIVACSGDAVITCATTLAGPVAYGDAALADFREPARVPCNESIGAGITCGAGPWAAFRAVPSGGAGPSGSEAPLSNVRSGSDLGGLLDHPGAARIQLATPILIGPENGLTVGF
jgi:hypothetical protein